MVEKGQDQIGVEVFNGQIAWSALETVGGKPKQQCKGVGIGRDRVRAGVALAEQMVANTVSGMMPAKS